VARPNRRSSVRHRRSSRLWPSSTCLRPGSSPWPGQLGLLGQGRPALRRAAGAAGPAPRRPRPAARRHHGGGRPRCRPAGPAPSATAPDGTKPDRRPPAAGPGRAGRPRRGPPSRRARDPPRSDQPRPPPTGPAPHRRGPSRTGWRWWPGRREVVGQQHEHGGRRWLLHRLQEGRAAARGQVDVGDHQHLAGGLERPALGPGHDGPGHRRRLIDAPDRSTTTRSGWVPARARRQVLQWPHPPSGHSRAAARPGPPPASPIPDGPWKR
jgi:hypothetical protein